jgi:aldehyde dehydrogenase (NAD+)
MSARIQVFDPQHRDRLFIGGEWVRPASASLIDVVDATTEEVIAQVAEARPEDVERAVSAARTAFDEGPWPRMSHEERAEYLRAIAAAIRRRQEKFATIQSRQMGILYKEAPYHSIWSAEQYDYFADKAVEFPFVERRVAQDGGKLSLLVREPVGVVGAIIPWNGPVTLIATKLAPALLAGCTFVLRGAPEGPGEALLMAEIAEEVGLPPGVLSVVIAREEASEALVRDPRVDKIVFTGSTTVGRKIASTMGDRIGRVTLELGGKCAALILDDYDIGEAAVTLASSGVRMTGQSCSSLTRIIVPRSRHDAFVEALSAEFAAVRVGDPFNPEIGMGPLASSRQRETVERYIAAGKRGGATLATGGGRPRDLDRGFFVEPTVFANVDNSSKIAQEEIFGPVLCVIPADDERHAVDLANDSIYGLSASVFSHDIEKVYDIARRLRTGTVGHNGPRSDFGIGFGGFKQSGIGRDGGDEGLLGYLEPKAVILDEEPARFRTDSSTSREGASA